jgi:hypothetical protein
MLSSTYSKYHLYRLSGNYRDTPKLRSASLAVAHLMHARECALNVNFSISVLSTIILVQVAIKINSRVSPRALLFFSVFQSDSLPALSTRRYAHRDRPVNFES